MNNYRLQRSRGKVMFSQASVILSMGGGVCQTPLWADTPQQADTPSPTADGYCSGW